MVLRINRLEEQLRQANGRIEQLENAEHRLEDQFQKFRQDVEVRFGEPGRRAAPPAAVSATPAAAAGRGRGAGHRQATKVGRLRPRRRAERAGRAPAARDHAAERAACPPCPARRRAARPRQGPDAACPARNRTDDRRLGRGDARWAARAVQHRAAEFPGGPVPAGGGRVQGVHVAEFGPPPHARRGVLRRRDLFPALAPARGGRAISQGDDRLREIVARARKHGSPRPGARRRSATTSRPAPPSPNSASAIRTPPLR